MQIEPADEHRLGGQGQCLDHVGAPAHAAVDEQRHVAAETIGARCRLECALGEMRVALRSLLRMLLASVTIAKSFIRPSMRRLRPGRLWGSKADERHIDPVQSMNREAR